MVNHQNRKKTAERHVLVTTTHRGVFAGYAADTSGATIKLARRSVLHLLAGGKQGLSRPRQHGACRWVSHRAAGRHRASRHHLCRGMHPSGNPGMGGGKMVVALIRGAVPDWNGSGDGSGDGDGSGYGSGSYWLATVPAFAMRWTPEQRAHLKAANDAGAVIAFWKSDAAGRACNGGSNAPVKPGVVETTKGPLVACRAGTLHATTTPPAWEGERLWVVAMWGETVRDGNKIGALKREIIGECT